MGRGKCLHLVRVRFVHPSVCPLPPSFTVSNPPTLQRAGGQAGASEGCALLSLQGAGEAAAR